MPTPVMMPVCWNCYQPGHKKASKRKNQSGDEKDPKWKEEKGDMGKGNSEPDRKAPRKRQEAEIQVKVAEQGAKWIRKIL